MPHVETKHIIDSMAAMTQKLECTRNSLLLAAIHDHVPAPALAARFKREADVLAATCAEIVESLPDS